MNSAHIIRQVIIRNNKVFCDGELLFSLPPDQAFNDFAKQFYKHLAIDYAKFYKMSSLCKLGFLACEVLLKENVLEDVSGADVAIVLANAASSLHADKVYQDSIAGAPSPALFVYTLPNIVIGELCIRHELKGENTFFIQETLDAAFLEEYVTEIFSSTETIFCITGWMEMDIHGNYDANLVLIKKSDYTTSDTLIDTFEKSKIYE